MSSNADVHTTRWFARHVPSGEVYLILSTQGGRIVACQGPYHHSEVDFDLIDDYDIGEHAYEDAEWAQDQVWHPL